MLCLTDGGLDIARSLDLGENEVQGTAIGTLAIFGEVLEPFAYDSKTLVYWVGVKPFYCKRNRFLFFGGFCGVAWSRCTITDGLFRSRLDSGKGVTEYFPYLGSGEEEVFDRGDGLPLVLRLFPLLLSLLLSFFLLLFLFLYRLLFLDPDV